MSDQRGMQIGIVVAVTAAAIGLISGVESSGREVASYVDRRAPASAPVEARSYTDERSRAYGPNAEQARTWWPVLRGAAPDRFAAVVQTDADRDAALVRRAGRRAYDGAPPTIPHAVDQIAPPACLSCHGEGIVVAGKTAPVMSHPRHDSCVQCHVVAIDPRPDVDTPPILANDFVGVAAPHGGERAWPGAPPTIPHRTWMRERCDSCHGPRGALGMKSTHPWRQSCTQCHAPSAVLDQRPPQAIGPTGGAP